MFQEIGERCGGLVEVAKLTSEGDFLRFAILKVKGSASGYVPETLLIRRRGVSFAFRLFTDSYILRGFKEGGSHGLEECYRKRDDREDDENLEEGFESQNERRVTIEGCHMARAQIWKRKDTFLSKVNVSYKEEKTSGSIKIGEDTTLLNQTNKARGKLTIEDSQDMSSDKGKKKWVSHNYGGRCEEEVGVGLGGQKKPNSSHTFTRAENGEPSRSNMMNKLATSKAQTTPEKYVMQGAPTFSLGILSDLISISNSEKLAIQEVSTTQAMGGYQEKVFEDEDGDARREEKKEVTPLRDSKKQKLTTRSTSTETSQVRDDLVHSTEGDSQSQVRLSGDICGSDREDCSSDPILAAIREKVHKCKQARRKWGKKGRRRAHGQEKEVHRKRPEEIGAELASAMLFDSKDLDSSDDDECSSVSDEDSAKSERSFNIATLFHHD